jgi:putative membrane protein
MYGGGWGMGHGGPFMILFWILIVIGVVLLVKWLAGQSPVDKGPRERTPLEFLRERYARGEIDREEFAQKRRDLEPPA